jgi:hypothetical protein
MLVNEIRTVLHHNDMFISLVSYVVIGYSRWHLSF